MVKDTKVFVEGLLLKASHLLVVERSFNKNQLYLLRYLCYSTFIKSFAAFKLTTNLYCVIIINLYINKKKKLAPHLSPLFEFHRSNI